MRSEGVGSMNLYTPDGKPFPGFKNVVFVKQCAQKLASVGKICDAGMVCVFDKDGLSVFEQKDIGESCSHIMREIKKLAYSLSLSIEKQTKKILSQMQ